MKQPRFALALLTAFTSIAAYAQVEGQDVSPTRSEVQPMLFEQPILADSSRINSVVPYSTLQKPELPLLRPGYDHTTSNYTLPMIAAPKPYQLWNGASIIVYGGNNQMLGLMMVLPRRPLRTLRRGRQDRRPHLLLPLRQPPGPAVTRR